MVPSIDGTRLHFDNVGLYDALFIMQDVETRTLWNHITGEALYGPHVGRTLGPVGNLLQISVEQALAMNPATEIAISDRMYFAGGKRLGTATGLGPGAGPDAARSIPPPRERPRPQGQPRINADAELMDQFVPTLGAEDLRRPRMIDPVTFTPTALFVDAAVARVEGREIHLDDGSVFRSGVLYDREGLAQFPNRPQQLFTRWYGFALTFPGSEVFGQ